MKKLILLLLVSFSLNSFSQQSTLEWHTDVKKSIEISLETKKPIMLFFTGSDWCGWCKKLVREVYKTPQFSKWAKNNVVLLDLDFNRNFQQKINNAKQGKVKLSENENMIIDLSRTFGVRGYPTIWFVNAAKSSSGEVKLIEIGSTGYVAGGPTKWIESAEKILSNK